MQQDFRWRLPAHEPDREDNHSDDDQKCDYFFHAACNSRQ
jgi:hypothetical protein